MLTVNAFDHIVLNVRDVDLSAKWYGQTLGMERRDARAPSGDVRTSLFFGGNKINLRPLDASQADWFTGRNPGAGGADLCFLTELEPDAVLAHLRHCGVSVELGPVDKRGAKGPIRSVYVRDPDGNLIEIASYP
ncbi:VOC family protein [Brevundimonas sp.]|uniref:VOC family protein n=1 Tax=Brevundimonas sp. TaxID=1871086 RepID=UPI003D0E2A05